MRRLITGRRVDEFDCVSISWQISEYIIQAYKNGMFQKVLPFVSDVCVCSQSVQLPSVEHLALAGKN